MGRSPRSGYDWYQVQPINTPGESEELPFGWVAAADKDGTPWLVSDAPECEAVTTAAEFAAIRPILGLACYGNEELSFAARLVQPEATCGVDIGWTIDPDWLACTCPQPTYLLAQAETDEFLDVAFDPAIDTTGLEPGVESADWQAVTVTGHFDHDAAKTCTWGIEWRAGPARSGRDRAALPLDVRRDRVEPVAAS